jgi:hypothetical protein
MAMFSNLPTKVTYHYDIEKPGYNSIADSFYLLMDTSFVIQMEKINTSAPVSMHDEFRLWPNPAENHLNIGSGTAGVSSIEISSMSGQQIYSTISEGRIHLGHLLRGIYFIRIKTDQGSIYTGKIIKK